MNDILDKYLTIIHEQMQYNSLKNIFCINSNPLCFNEITKESILSSIKEIKKLSVIDKEYLIQFYVNKFQKTLYSTNQYIDFQKKDYLEIRKIFELLLQDISNQQLLVEQIEERHYERIQSLIKKTNPVIYKLNSNNDIIAKTFVCAEYSAQFQIDLLGIEINVLREPILDIGCGEHGYLVEFLRNNNLEAYGIDRIHKTEDYYIKNNWLEFNYGQQKWGTIISNLSFSNHFINHYLQNDKVDVVYAQTYMKILKSLSIGGSWIYAPSVPFIEDLLPNDKYLVNRSFVNSEFTKTIITVIR